MEDPSSRRDCTPGMTGFLARLFRGFRARPQPAHTQRDPAPAMPAEPIFPHHRRSDPATTASRRLLDLPRTVAALTDASVRPPLMLGVGPDNLLYTKATLADPWVVVPDSGPMIAATI